VRPPAPRGCRTSPMRARRLRRLPVPSRAPIARRAAGAARAHARIERRRGSKRAAPRARRSRTRWRPRARMRAVTCTPRSSCAMRCAWWRMRARCCSTSAGARATRWWCATGRTWRAALRRCSGSCATPMRSSTSTQARRGRRTGAEQMSPRGQCWPIRVLAVSPASLQGLWSGAQGSLAKASRRAPGR